MEPAIVVALLWALFGAFHIGLTTARVRGWLVSRLGELGFSLAYSAFALTTFSFVIVYYAQHRYDGAAGLALGTIPALRPILIAVIVLSVALMTGTFATYRLSPYVVLGKGSFPPPRGLERITRHPFFVGLVMVSAAHVMLATHLAGAVFAGGLGAIAVVGMAHQDRKLKARYGEAFVRYLDATSAVPFAAIIAGRQQMEWRELPVLHLAAGIVVAVALRTIHGSIFADNGVPLIAGTAAAVSLIGLRALVRKSTPLDDSIAAPPARAHQAAR